jgi:superfamily II DNA or RNA helicase
MDEHMLRDYQSYIVDKNMDALDRKVDAVLNGVFTGAGKTVMFCEMARRNPGRTLIIVPLRELAWQAVDKVREVAGEDPELEMANFRAGEDEWFSPKVVVASKQTLLSRRGGQRRYTKFTDISLVIVDEAHMQFSEQVLEMLRWFNANGAMVSGWTATPFRMDGTPMRAYYQEEMCNLDVQWAITNGWSVPPVCKLSRVAELDLSTVTVSGDDFNQTQLQAAVEKEAALHRIALITKEEMEGPTVVFTPSVNSAKGVCHYLTNNYGIPAVYVYGTQDEEERADAIRAFKSGQARVLVNCQVVAIGFDFPPTSTLILGRPTKSRAFWLQCVGRATRPLRGVVDYEGSDAPSRIARIAASGKPRFKIVDCTDASLDHRLVTAVDMFVTGDKDVKQAVKKAAAEAQEPLTQEALDALAQQELERRLAAQEIEARRKRMQGQATGTVVGREVDLAFTGKRSIGTYTNPLKGKFAGCRMADLPDYYIDWGTRSLKGWPRTLFAKEKDRRRAKAAC